MLVPLPLAEALGIGPPSFELDLQMDGSNSTTVYLLSDGLEGELVIGSEDLPFRIEPSKINMSKEDNYRNVELTFYGNETLEPGVYEGMVSFIAKAGGFISLGINIRAKINLIGEAQEEELEIIAEEEPEIEIEAESEEEPDIIAEEEPEIEIEAESEVEPEIIAEDEEIEIESEEESESEENSGSLYVIGLIAALGLIIILWKRR